MPENFIRTKKLTQVNASQHRLGTVRYIQVLTCFDCGLFSVGAVTILVPVTRTTKTPLSDQRSVTVGLVAQ